MGLKMAAHVRGEAESSYQNENHIHTYHMEREQLHQILEEQQGRKLLRQAVTSRRSVTYSPGYVLWKHEPTINVLLSGGPVGLECKDRQETSRDEFPATCGTTQGSTSSRCGTKERRTVCETS